MAHCQIETEVVPGLRVAVTQVRVDASAEVGGEADVVEAVLPIERIDPMTAADEGADDLRVMLKCVAGDVLKMLADQLRASLRHMSSPPGSSGAAATLPRTVCKQTPQLTNDCGQAAFGKPGAVDAGQLIVGHLAETCF